ncbi:MAG: glycosyltransferase family 2 protein [Thermoplasmata archaeon]
MTVTSFLLLFVTIYSVFVLFYFAFINSGYFILINLALKEMMEYLKLPKFDICEGKACGLLPSITILVPSYNEEKTIVNSVEALLNLNYPNLEVIVINDGSTDNTLTNLKDHFKLISSKRSVEEKIQTEEVKNVFRSITERDLLVIDKENGGKADSLNAGINHSRTDLFLAIDADTLIERDSLKKLVKKYMYTDAKVVALGGIVRVANNCEIRNSEVKEARLPKKFLPAVQVMEYIRAFLFGRTGWSRLNCLPIISGAFGLFDRDAVTDINGYRTDTVGEDIDLVVRLHKYMRDKKKDYDISFLPDPVCWTQVPEKRKVLGRQRSRWQRGLTETISFNKDMLFNPRYGKVGTLALPFFLFFEMFGPIIEISGYFIFVVSYFMGWIDHKLALIFLSLAVFYGVLLSIFSLLLEELTLKRYKDPVDRIKLMGLAFLENFGYRQFHSWWRLKGLIQFIRKDTSWGNMEREDF